MTRPLSAKTAVRDLLGRLASRLEHHPRAWALARRTHNGLRRVAERIGVEVPRHTPAGLRAFREMTGRAVESTAVPGDAPLILFVSPRGWATTLLVDTVLAWAMRLRGYRVAIWSCGRSFPVCHMTNSSEAPPMPCLNCRGLHDDLLSGDGIEVVRTAGRLTDEEVETLRRELAPLDAEALEGWRFRGRDLGDIARLAANWFLRTSRFEDAPAGTRTLRDFLLLAASSRIAGERIFEALDPQLVVMLNGIFTEEAVARALAEERDVPWVSYERAFGFEHFVFTRRKLVNWFDLDDAWSTTRDRPLEAEQESDLDAFMADWRRGSGAVVRYWHAPEERDEVIRAELGIEAGARVLVLFTNVVWDTAAFDRDVTFPSMWAWIHHSIELAVKRPDLHLVVRIHPGEVRVKGWESDERVADHLASAWPELPPNVSVVAPGTELSSYRLVALAETVAVYTSTIGLEAAMEGRRVIVAGDTHYRGKGFTLDPEDETAYARAIDDGRSAHGPDEPTATLARRYAHLFFLRHMLPLPLFEEQRMGNPHLRFDSLAALEPGANADLDRICSFIAESIEDPTPRALVRD